MAIDPTGRDLKAFRDEDDGTPFVMLNLLRFRPDGGEESYDRYLRALSDGIFERHNGEVLHVGKGDVALVAEDGQAWDAVLVVRFPNRTSFSDMIRDPEYQAVAELRTQALTEAVLQPTTPW